MVAKLFEMAAKLALWYGLRSAYKKNIYENLAQCGSTFSADRHIVAHFIDVSILGFISNVSKFTTATKIQLFPISVKHKIIKTVLDGSFTVYCNRNSGAISID